MVSVFGLLASIAKPYILLYLYSTVKLISNLGELTPRGRPTLTLLSDAKHNCCVPSSMRPYFLLSSSFLFLSSLSLSLWVAARIFLRVFLRKKKEMDGFYLFLDYLIRSSNRAYVERFQWRRWSERWRRWLWDKGRVCTLWSTSNPRLSRQGSPVKARSSSSHGCYRLRRRWKKIRRENGGEREREDQTPVPSLSSSPFSTWWEDEGEQWRKLRRLV